MTQLLPNGKQQFVDINGKPLVGGKVYHYTVATLTPKATYQDIAQSIPNTNPVILDSRGQAGIYGTGNYRQVLTDALDVQIWDQVVPDSGGALIADLANTTDPTKGISLIPTAERMVPNISTLRTLPKTGGSIFVFVEGYYAVGDGGGGHYWLDAADTTTADNNGSIIVASDGGRWKLNQVWGAYFTQFGAKGDGTTDDTAACQACIDACKGRMAVADAGKVFFAAGLTLSGSTYNLTNIRFDGWMKLRPDAGASTFGGAWVGLLIKDCDSVTINPRWDGNRTNMTQREQIFCVGIAGASNLQIPTAEFKEVRGDGLYVGQSNWLANSTVPNRIRVGRITATNSADDGRNAVSIISVNGFVMESLVSAGVGGTVNGVIQPGGFDVEPDFGYETCSDIWVGYLDVTTAGTNGVGIFGKSISGNDANRDWNCFDIRIDDCRVLKTGTTGSALTAPQYTRVADLQIKGTITYNTVRGQGPNHDYSQRVQADWKLNNVTIGVLIGTSDAVNDFKINIDVSNYNSAGARVTQCSRGRLTGRVTGALAASTAFAVQCHNQGRGGVTPTDVAFEVDAPYDGVVTRAMRNEPGNLVAFGTGTVARNCDWTGYPSLGATNDALVRTENILGYTSGNANPSSGSWVQGTFFRNDAPASAANKTTIGWARANTGSNNVLNTDWYVCIVTNT